MVLKCVVIFFLLQDLTANRYDFSFNPRINVPEKLSAFDFNKNKNGLRRGRRHLSSTIALLWPQVVGPVEKGVIEESDFSQVPKTLLEHRLDLIRRKAKQEEEDRLLVRDYLKKLTEVQDDFYGYSYRNSLTNDYT